MHVQFVTSKPILIKDLFNGRMGKYSIREYINGETTRDCRYLIDMDSNNLAVISDDQDCTSCLITCDLNKNTPWIILDAIASEFDCDIQESIMNGNAR
jgi:hypothetical protein